MALFPHRYDFLYADVPDPTEKPHWKTESRYPLSDRAIQQSTQLWGVRFGKQTSYCLLDIDTTSVYHPAHDRFAIANLAAALEPLGFVNYVACTSSYSGGLHVYFPFQAPESSWKVAAAVTARLTQAGFKLRSGQLEVFPNAKPYTPGQLPSLFNAHRLPLQMGSYLLDAEFQPIWSDRSTFVQHWNFAKQRNHLNNHVLKHLLQSSRKPYAISGKAEKFLNDLTTEIEAGWTGYGQTNRLLGRIAMRAYVFHHWLAGGDPLTGQALVDHIVATARSLPGYTDWCRHQPDIEQRSAEWARCVEASRYFPYGSRSRSIHSVGKDADTSTSTLTWNQKQSESVRTKIRQAIAHLLETNALPAGTTQRFQRLTTYGISGSSLYRHRDLWHPSCLTMVLDRSVEVSAEFVASTESSNPIEDLETVPPESLESLESLEFLECTEALEATSTTRADRNTTNLFPPSGCNPLLNQASDPFSPNATHPMATLGCNAAWNPVSSSESKLDHLEKRSNAWVSSLDQRQRMQQFLDSGDPILMAEARSQMQRVDHAVDCSRGHFGGHFGDRFRDHSRDHSMNQVVNQLSSLRFPDPLQELAWPQPHQDLDQFPDWCSDRSPSHPSQEYQSQERSIPLLDLSTLLATIAVHIRRKQWTRSQVHDRLTQRFGKPHQAFLTETELMEWLHWLQTAED